jgi:uncharacterized protein YjbJ (UPF0337 family)
MRSFKRPQAKGKVKDLIGKMTPNKTLFEVEGKGKMILMDVNEDKSRIKRVAAKIFAGYIFHDLNLIVNVEEIESYHILNDNFRAIRDEGIKRKINFWCQMTTENCIHEVVSKHVVIRRKYLIVYSNGRTQIFGFASIGIYGIIFCAWFKETLDSEIELLEENLEEIIIE